MLNLVFYGTDGVAAKALAAILRASKTTAYVRDAGAFCGTIEPCDKVVLLPCVTDLDRRRLIAAYGDKVEQSAKPHSAPVAAVAEISAPVVHDMQDRPRRGRPPKVQAA